MQCSCGGVMVERQETKDKIVVTKYEKCVACGRVYIRWRKNEGAGNAR
jgi:hypothetical protein